MNKYFLIAFVTSLALNFVLHFQSQSYADKLNTQNQAIIGMASRLKEEESRRESERKILTQQYRKDIAAIKYKQQNAKPENMQQLLDVLVSGMKEISDGPDNP